MAMVSDSPPLEEEFKQWIKEVEPTGGQVPMKQEVEEKKRSYTKDHIICLLSSYCEANPTS